MAIKVRTRFAPSPTGSLHLGGARTALFNWLFARHHGGTFLLRIEDTDRARSTDEATEVIFRSLRWLQLDWDEPPVFQSRRQERHKQIVQEMLEAGKAYLCFASPEELDAARTQAQSEGRVFHNDLWRDKDPSQAPEGARPVVRFKTPREGQTTFADGVMGPITVANAQLDDLVLLRSDGTPTYNLAVVIDDHDMAITHVIRGNDHINNTPRQIHMYQAMGWQTPEFSHVPMILGADGAKLSKRHGAVSTESYKDMGFLPEAMTNYLARLGWAHGDDEIFSREQAVQWFSLEGIGRSPARFDITKLTGLNAHAMRTRPPETLLQEVLALTEREAYAERMRLILPNAALRAKTLLELQETLSILWTRPVASDIPKPPADFLAPYLEELKSAQAWKEDILEELTRSFCNARSIALKDLAQSMRLALTGKKVSPPLFIMLEALGRDESLARIEESLKGV